jgi:hypothetical protein
MYGTRRLRPRASYEKRLATTARSDAIRAFSNALAFIESQRHRRERSDLFVRVWGDRHGVPAAAAAAQPVVCDNLSTLSTQIRKSFSRSDLFTSQ